MRPFLALAALLLLAPAARAADYPVKVTAARVGLPPGGKATIRDDSGQAGHVSKFATWAPVYVELELAASINDPVELVIESPDSDEVTTTLALPLNLAGVGGKVSAADLGVIGYVRPTNLGEVTVTVRTKDGKALSEPFRTRAVHPREPLVYVVLSLGSTLPGFDLPVPATGGDSAGGFRGGRVELATLTEMAQLPDRWFGYETADLVILNTGSGNEVFAKLFGETGSASDKAKRAALLEWVRRGGRLVVGVGENAQTVAGYCRAGAGGERPELYRLLPLEVRGPRLVPKLALSWPAGEASKSASTLAGDLTPAREPLQVPAKERFTVADLADKASRPARVLVPLPPDASTKVKEPVAGQDSYGLGRVTVVGFDLDRAPFTDFSQRPAFWDWVLREGGANRASGGDGRSLGSTGTMDNEDRAAAALRKHADDFEGVPVVSFGWVALLIVLYILLIGPVEYFFLKRVLGRLELTWITFPIIVLTVSLAAYYSAYSLKGRDLKLNKLDVVDVDPATGRVYGTTLFTIFSPRTDTYTIGVTPGQGWGDAEPGTAMNWVGSPRGGRASLMRRKYSYHADADGVADGLEKVPVQVWSTKSFSANWSGRFDPTAPGALVKSNLYHPTGSPDSVSGDFTMNLPVPVLTDCFLLYAGQVYPVAGGTIRPGDTVQHVFLNGTAVGPWLQKEGRLADALALAPGSGSGRGGPQPNAPRPGADRGTFPLLGVLFHESSLKHGEGVVPDNASLRRLDQSWRLSAQNRSEVILVGRAVLPVGPAEESLSGPSAASRLWLRGLPGSGDREPMPRGSTGRQETWVRVYLPVR
jgi:hypothetical protein